MPRKAQVKVQSATSTNTKLALATAALLIASGLAFIAAPSVRGPGSQAKCGLNSFEFRGPGTAHGTCYSGKKVTASIRGAKSQTLRTNLTAQCLAECLNCPAGYEAVAGQGSDCLISCVKAKPQPKKRAVKKSSRKSSRKSDPVMMAQDNVGSCTDRDGNPLPAPNDGAGPCRGHDGSPNDYVWTGPGPEAESEYCPSNPDDAAPCTYRCPTGQRVNPETGICGCTASQYTDEYGNCLEENDCESLALVINRVDRTCLPVAPGSCVDENNTASDYPPSGRYSGYMTACENAPEPQPGQTNAWTYDANCSTNQACTFQCGENRVPNEENYCEYCSNGFSVNASKTACVCNGVIEDMGSFERCTPCQNDLVPNADNSACECGPGLYYSTEYNHCMSRESCVGGDDLIVNDSTRECHTCEEGTVPNNTHTACVCPTGECEDENGVCATGNCDIGVNE